MKCSGKADLRSSPHRMSTPCGSNFKLFSLRRRLDQLFVGCPETIYQSPALRIIGLGPQTRQIPLAKSLMVFLAEPSAAARSIELDGFKRLNQRAGLGTARGIDP